MFEFFSIKILTDPKDSEIIINNIVTVYYCTYLVGNAIVCKKNEILESERFYNLFCVFCEYCLIHSHHAVGFFGYIVLWHPR